MKEAVVLVFFSSFFSVQLLVFIIECMEVPVDSNRNYLRTIKVLWFPWNECKYWVHKSIPMVTLIRLGPIRTSRFFIGTAPCKWSKQKRKTKSPPPPEKHLFKGFCLLCSKSVKKAKLYLLFCFQNGNKRKISLSLPPLSETQIMCNTSRCARLLISLSSRGLPTFLFILSAILKVEH